MVYLLPLPNHKMTNETFRLIACWRQNGSIQSENEDATPDTRLDLISVSNTALFLSSLEEELIKMRPNLDGCELTHLSE